MICCIGGSREQCFFCDDGGGPQATNNRAKDIASLFGWAVAVVVHR